MTETLTSFFAFLYFSFTLSMQFAMCMHSRTECLIFFGAVPTPRCQVARYEFFWYYIRLVRDDGYIKRVFIIFVDRTFKPYNMCFVSAVWTVLFCFFFFSVEILREFTKAIFFSFCWLISYDISHWVDFHCAKWRVCGMRTHLNRKSVYVNDGSAGNMPRN